MEVDLSGQEKEAIAVYKKYFSKHFPWVEKLGDLVVLNFDYDAYKSDTKIEALQKYLDELKPYLKKLSKAADLRQFHYERWIQNQKEEDLGHQHWREGLNAIVKDAEEKFFYWSNVQEQIFNKAIEDFEKIPDNLAHLDLITDNIQGDFYKSEKKEKVPSKSKRVYYRRPRISEAQKKKLANARKKQRARENAQVNALLEESMQKAKEEEEKLFDGNVTLYDAGDIIENFDSFRYDFAKNQKESTMTYNRLKGNTKKFYDLGVLLSNWAYQEKIILPLDPIERNKHNGYVQLFIDLNKFDEFNYPYLSAVLNPFLNDEFEINHFQDATYVCVLFLAYCIKKMTNFNPREIEILYRDILETLVDYSDKIKAKVDIFMQAYCTVFVNAYCITRIYEIESIRASPLASYVFNKSIKINPKISVTFKGRKYDTNKNLLKVLKDVEKLL